MTKEELIKIVDEYNNNNDEHVSLKFHNAEYYALVYDSTDISVNKYQAVYSSYATLEKKDKTKMYYIDLSNTMNKSYYTEEKSNPDAKNLEELKLGDFTLIKVKKGKIVKYIEDYDAVKKELGIED